MLTIERILVPTDYSPCAEGAFTHAAYLADLHGAELHVLHVVEERGEPLEAALRNVAITPEDIAGDLDLPLPERADRRADEPVPVTEVEEHAPEASAAILEYARAHGVDLIVMGTQGRRGVRRLAMGSVAEEVVRQASCPVFTVRHRPAPPDHEAPPSTPWAIRRVLAPLDLSERSYLGARHAAELAAAYEATLDLLYVVDPGSVPTATMPYLGSFDTMVGAVEERAGKALRRVSKELQREVPALRDRVSERVRSGQPASEILAAVEEEGADLLVLCSHGHSGLRRLLLGSVAQQLVRRSPCPVFTLKSFGRSLLPASSDPREEEAEA
jgi:nucleotide-binding universal stress UspA family protein